MADSVPASSVSGLVDALGFRQLFRAFKLAADPRKIILASIAIVVIYIAGRALDRVWPESSKAVVSNAGISEVDFFQASGFSRARTLAWVEISAKSDSASRAGLFKVFLERVRGLSNQLTEASVSLSPRGILGVLIGGVATFAWLLLVHPVFGILFMAIWLAVWAVFGGAIARMAALDVTRGDKISISDACGFARRKFLSFLLAPLGPVIGLVGCCVLLAIGGVVGAIPGVGTVLAGVFWFLAVALGFLMALLTVGFALGWPLMYPTIAVEGSDAFDAFSRSYAYVSERIWRAMWYFGVSLVYGSICFLFVKLIARLSLFFAQLGVGLTMNWGSASGKSGDIAHKLDAMWTAPALDFSNPFYGAFPQQPLTSASWVGAILMSVWAYLVFAVVAGFLVSFLQSSATLVYVLLRRDIDATDIEEVYLDDEDMPESPESTPSATAASASPSPSTPGSLASLPVVGTGDQGNPSPNQSGH